jgi:hypothetical protein
MNRRNRVRKMKLYVARGGEKRLETAFHGALPAEAMVGQH